MSDITDEKTKHAVYAGIVVDVAEADLDRGEIRDVTTGETFKAVPFPPFIQKIIEAGGLINSIKNR